MFQGSAVWVDVNMGYLLPGTVVSVLGSHVKVRLDDNREVIVPKDCMS